MKFFSNQPLGALIIVALLSSCSRPYATFQKTTQEHFYTKANAQTPLPVATAQPEVMDTPTPTPKPTTIAEALDQYEAVASAKATTSLESHKIAKRVARMRTIMNTTQSKSAVNTAPTTPKLNLMQRVVMKSINKKIEKHLAPQQPMVRNLLTIGLIVGLIGLLLVLIGTGTVYSLGYVGIIVGLILIIASLL